MLELSSGGSITAYNTFGPDGLVSRREGSTSTYYAFDMRGSTVHRLNAAGAILTSHTQDAFGAQLSSGATTDPYACLGAQTGYRADTGNGMLLLGHRMYDPSAGRFVNRDPIGYAGGLNLYAYCGGDPVNLVDPSGLDPDMESLIDQLDSRSLSNGIGLREIEVEPVINGLIDAIGGGVVRDLARKSGCAFGRGDNLGGFGYAVLGAGYIFLQGVTFGRLKWIVGPTSGRASAGTSFSHWIPKRYFDEKHWLSPVLRWLSGTKDGKVWWNGRVVSNAEHAATDNHYYTKGFKDASKYPILRQQLNRLPEWARTVLYGTGIREIDKLLYED